MKQHKKKEAVVKSDNLKKDLEDLRQQLARAVADYDNLQKRVAKQNEELEKVYKTNFFTKLLPVFDQLLKAQSHLNDSGIAMTLSNLEEVASEEGFVKIRAEVGSMFDERFHEALDVVNDKSKKNGEIVIKELDGWKRKDDYVVRPAKVIVNSK